MDSDTSSSERWRRRGLMTGLVGLVVVGGMGFHRLVAEMGSRSTRNEVHPFFGDLGPGSGVQRWTVVAVHPVSMGGIAVVLETAKGSRYQVDVLRRNPGGATGVANTEHLSLFLQNNGNGSTATDEEQGLGAMALASVLAERERSGAEIPDLLTLEERTARHPDGAFGVSLQ